MNIFIVEDEEPAQKKLQKTLAAVDASANVVGVTGSIRGTVEWLRTNNNADLILMDIELADGRLSFGCLQRHLCSTKPNEKIKSK